jgi:hypothetical protein
LSSSSRLCTVVPSRRRPKGVETSDSNK